MRKISSIFVFFCSLVWGTEVNAQCEVNGSVNPDTLLCGDTVFLSAVGLGGTPLVNVDFNSGAAGNGWVSTAGVDFTNPCDPGPDGVYMWMGDGTPAPRSLTTVTLDLSCDVNICFDFRMAVQGGTSPCEGPDLANEGVFLQYSPNNGGNWVNVFYFDPNINNSGGTTSSPYTQWQNYCFQLSGLTTTSQIRWAQTATSGNGFDHWGIDNVQIFNNCGAPYSYLWDNGMTAADTFVTPVALTDTAFVVSYFNATDTCFDTVDLHILPRPIQAFGEMELCDTVGGIDAQLLATGANTYQWNALPGGDMINSSNFGCDTCNTSWANPAVTTSYEVSSDLTGICHGTDTVTVHVVSAFNPSFSFNSPVCQNEGIQQFVPAHLGGYWTGAGVVDSALGTFDPMIAGAGMIPITYTIPGACANTLTSTIEIIALPDPTITAPEQYCLDGAPIQLFAATPGGVFSGTGVNSGNQTFDPSLISPGVYNIFYTLNTPCHHVDTHSIRLLDSIPFSVQTPLSLCDNSAATLIDNIQIASVYTEPVLTNFTGTGITDTQLGYFNANGLIGGIYTIDVSITDTFGLCMSTDAINITVNETEYANLLTQFYCSGDGNVFIQLDKPLQSLNWFNYPLTTGLDSISLNNFGAFNTADYEQGEWVFDLSYTNANGCTGQNLDTLTIMNTPSIPDPFSEDFCQNEEVVLEAIADNTDSVYWEYRIAIDTTSLGYGVPNANFGNAPDPAAGPYTVYAKAVNGACESDFVSYVIPVRASPEALFKVDYRDTLGVTHYDSLVSLGDTIYSYLPSNIWLRAQTYEEPDSLYWNLNFNDWSGNGDIIENIVGNVLVLSQDFRSPGIHQLLLVQTNEFGCSDNYSIFLEVLGSEQIPNVFTPNGDGINDLFTITAPVREFDVTIFNRWGQEVYRYNCNQCSQKQKGWDGANASDGTYFFVVKGKYNDGSVYQESGTVTLTGAQQ